MGKPPEKRCELLIIAVRAVITLLVFGANINLAGGEKMVRRPLAHLYAINDRQFQRTPSVMLGA